MVAGDVRGLGVGQLLDTVEFWHGAQRDLQMRIFVAAAQFADLHHPDSRPADGRRVLNGMERGVRLGGVGTPSVLEFAAAELGPRIGRSPYAARMLIADALDLRHRLPRLWARVCAGEVTVPHARHVAQQTRELTVQGAGVVDAGVVDYADGRLTWSRFDTLVAAKVIEADPQAAAAREHAAAAEEFAKVGRSNDHGQKTLYVRSSAAAVIRMDATLAYLADALAALGDTDTQDRRRAKAMLVLANPVQALQLLQTFAAHRHSTAAPAPDGTDQPDLLNENDDNSTDADSPDADSTDADSTGGASAAVERTAGGSDGCSDGRSACSDGGAGNDDNGHPVEHGHAEPADPASVFVTPWRPHQIRPDRGYQLGFDPRSLLPTATLYLHLYARTDTGEVAPVARWEGQGPITRSYVRDLLGPACRFTIKPVIDLAGLAPVDAYEIPDRHREAVQLRTPADVFPFASSTRRRHQLDHTQPYRPPDHGGPPGQTSPGNLAPMTTYHHRVKTHGRWQVKQPFPGMFVWRDPHGRTYLVDHTGTRPLGNTGSGATLPDLTIEIAPPTGTPCYYEPNTHAA